MSLAVRIDVDRLCCPRCGSETLQQAGDELACPACDARYGIDRGVPQLLKDPALFTHLEKIDYDAHHNIDEARREKVARDWQQVFERHGAVYGEVLEIGSGTGQLTWGLSHRFPFRSVHACDISTRFLLQADSLVGTDGAPVSYYACDANFLPFRHGSFDLVVGHSVLHHFIDYRKIIHDIAGLLRPGGMAIFYEPVLQGKILVAFMADLMRRIENNTKWGVLDDKDIARIEHMKRHIMKDKWIGHDRERLEKIEDKYVFDINTMRQLAYETGYASMEHSNLEMPKQGYRWFVNQHLLMEGVAPEKLQKYVFVMNTFMETVGEMIPGDIVTPMGYFVFRK